MRTIRHLLQVKGTDIWSIGPDDSVFEALRLMADKGIGALVVVKDDQIVGMISERDYARKIVLLGKTSRRSTVRDIMTPKVFTIHPDQTVDECMELMTEKRIRHVPVIEDDGTLVGVISIGDVVRLIIHRQRETIKLLEDRSFGP